MRETEPFALNSEACVTASELVRQFGPWQERALQQPVFIMRRGRPSLVLTSIDLMRRLCAPHGAADDDLLERLLDAMPSPVIVTDSHGQVDRINRAARLAFGEPRRHDSLSGLLPEASARFLSELCGRVRRAGAPRNTELAIGERRYRVAVVPVAAGALLVAEDSTSEEDALTAHARIVAIDRAIDLMGDLAWALIDARGYVASASAAFERMAGVERAILATVRFVSFLSAGDRSAVGDAIDAVVTDGKARRLDVHLTLRDGSERAVRLSLAPEQAGPGVRFLIALLAPAAPPERR
ncbi:PAS domain-containing protein [Sphingomonas sp.]|uniref:PAS domain-containing protein n=1 Tax=Sphingomonas sp. TaxID=28214 RepID=UPI002BFB340F|nr:PAS domain-containing protein [Sphingomonas sp.]HTG38725.1 PAS domain-containing protein [Sphingomonas sp.]